MQSPQPAPPSFFRVVVLLISFPLTAHAQSWISAAGRNRDIDVHRLETVLAQRASMDFKETPLKDVVQSLSEQFGVPIRLVVKKLEEAGVSPDTPITARIENLPLESSLRIILKEHELGFTIRDNVIVITTPEDLESDLITRVYPVLDLVTRHVANPQDGKATTVADYDSLIEVITATLDPDSWDDVGGPGAIDCLDNAGALIVSQIRDTHRQIDSLLTALRQAKALQGIASKFAPPAGMLSVPSYSVPLRTMRMAGPVPDWQLPQTHDASK